MSGPVRTKLSRANGGQSVHLPVEVAFPDHVEDVHVYKDGLRRVIVPADAILDGKVRLAHLLVSAGIAGTNGDAKRLIAQGGVHLNGEKVAPDASGSVAVSSSDVLSSGRRKFVRLLTD